MNRILCIAALLLAVLPVSAKEKIRVACVGNSITYGYLLPDPATQSYPAQLQEMLGDGYEVGNFGHSGATLLRHGHRPYFSLPEFRGAMDFRPDIAVIHLGVNDTDPRDWPLYGREFVTDYMALIDSLRSVNPEVRIIVARLSPLRASHFRFKTGTRDWRLKIQDAIDRVALATGAELIDFDLPLRDRQNLIHDGIHPDAEGATLLARTAFNGITGNYGGLKLPPIYQSGMVLQRNRQLHIGGTADAGSRISLTLDGRRYNAVADNRGQWSVTTPPLVAGKTYRMTVTDGRDTINLTDLLAGELWLATGQSNMEFVLSRSQGAKEAIDTCADPLMRIYNMQQIAPTNQILWPDSVLQQVDRLNYFLPARWEPVTPDNAPGFSAVAYYFARQLRDSLDVPVGVICNAVGGSPCEAWIDVNTLEAGMPEIFIDWTSNDYLQKWCQQRALTNVGSKPGARHPYEPGYLFSAGLRPLAPLDIAGVIWYQGESNAHNIEIHERLFPMFVSSLRNHFGNSDMPVCFTQLSSIDRPSWPEFRDSQRRMQQSIPGTYMAVTSDIGDSLDVHPVNKLDVGRRLARQALHHIYGHSLTTPCGPEPIGATACDGTVTVSFRWADSLHGSDGMPPRTFEIAEIDGIYYPAEATVTPDNKITLHNMNVKKPRFVRYGWQPFTRANLVNADNLPASTFALEVDNAADYDIEPGLEHGISAPYAGMLQGRIVVAGGCNFPSDPMAPDSRKKFYKGIYAADTAGMQWQRIGSLPEPAAYGASAVLPEGIVLIGGTTAESPLNRVLMLSVDSDGRARSAALPSLPVPLDNMAAAAIGRKIYVAGGNAGGSPSSGLYCLDLDNSGREWRKLRGMPGNPRVQPVMAAATAPDGETCLYLWGGFAPRHGSHEPSLELDGLCYSPARNKWTRLPAPVDAAGEPLSVGGGSACTLSDGRIAVCGGVNKDIFLEALKCQAPDYLSHPAEWYRFNPDILIFDPAGTQWSVAGTDSEAARAGAVSVPDSSSGFYLMGGEIKPRIRTAATIHFTDLSH